MRSFLLSLALIVSLDLVSQPLSRQELRDWFLSATTRKSALDSFKNRLEKIDSKSPVQECYYGICCALNIQYTSGMWGKIKLVNQSYDLLCEAVNRDPSDPELRFMRLTFEHFLPGFLGMSKDIPNDLAIIFSHADFVADNPALRKKALEFLATTHRCNADQNKLLQHQLADLNKKQTPVYATSVQ